jgi:S-DNA-T family DNA segregation ATPase FtsK/SpoIIIE
LNFYLLDPKGDISDFKSLNVPHVKRFVSTDEEIVQTLRWVVKTEADRRRKIMHEAGGFIDYWDLKKKRPDIELPLLYVVIDEVVTLSDRMDKETKSEFQGLLSQLVSQLPALGIRIFMIPHVVKDQVLKKTITDLIPCRISVMGDANHIENVTGASTKAFVHKLVNQGDMAVRLNNNKIQFVHGIIIADSNEGTDDFFDFLTSMWLKICPESLDTSKKGVEDKKVSRVNQGPRVEISVPTKEKKPTRSNSESKKQTEITFVEEPEIEEDEENEELDYDDENVEFDIWGEDK